MARATGEEQKPDPAGGPLPVVVLTEARTGDHAEIVLSEIGEHRVWRAVITEALPPRDLTPLG